MAKYHKKIALIGAGKIALEYLKVLQTFSEVSVCGIANRSGKGLVGLAKEFRIESCYNDWRDMLNRTDPDAVLILVSCDQIATVAEYCLNRKIPCLIEKPVGLFYDQAQKIHDIYVRNGCIHQVAMNRRFYSTVNRAINEVLMMGPIYGVHVEDHEPIDRMCEKSKYSDLTLDRWLIANGIHALGCFSMSAAKLRVWLLVQNLLNILLVIPLGVWLSLRMVL